jgi:hypothetical protein
MLVLLVFGSDPGLRAATARLWPFGESRRHEALARGSAPQAQA